MVTNILKSDKDMAKKRFKKSKNIFKIESLGYVIDTYEMHIFWRFVVDTSKIGRFIGKKAQKLDSTPIISIQDFH